MNLTFGHSPLLLILSVLAAAALTWWTYRTTVPDIGPVRKWLLGALRFMALALIVFMLFEPLFSRDRAVSEDPLLGILVDASESMLLADSLVGDSGAGTGDLLASIETLSANRRVQAWSFGADLVEADTLAQIRFDRTTTNLSTALEQLRERTADQPLGAVIVLSDGLHNAGTNPIHVAERFPAPVISVVHGDTTARRDIRLVQIVTNEIAYSGTSVPVRARIRNDGFEPRTISITLLSDGDLLENTSVSLPPDGAESTFDFEFVAGEPGARTLTVAVSRLDGEVTWRNNSASTSVQILDQKKSILLVAGSPSPDVASIVRMLDADENTDLTTRIQSGPARYFEGELPSDLSEYDLLIVAGFPGRATDPSHSARLAAAVDDGLPLLFVQDRNPDLRAVQRQWSEVLPAGVRVIRSTWTNTAFSPTRQAGDHAIFDIENRRDAGGWTRLPPLTANESRWEVIPGATVLATRRIRGITLDDPLFLVSRRAGHRSAALLAHGFWRWSNVPEDLETDAARWTQLLQNTIQWLYAAEDDRLVRVEPAERRVSEADAVILRGEVYDESLTPVGDASLTVDLETPSGESLPFEMRPIGNGRYTVDLGSLPAGNYSYTARAGRDDADLGTDSGTFSIGERSVEFRRTRADTRLMQQISTRTGGAAFHASEIGSVEAVLDTLSSYRPITRVVSAQIRLWQRVPLLIVVLVLVSLEWFFRKRAGMV